MQSIAFVSEKGGVGKTTTVLNLAAGLAARGKRVLVVDTDPQANSTFVLLKGEKPRRPALPEVLVAEAQAYEAIVPAPAFGGVDLLPADAALADATVTLANEVGRERRLRLAMEGVDGSYDFVLVDTAPTRSIITTNVLNYVRDLFVPMAPVLFGVLGLGQLQADVGQVRRFLDNRALRIGGIVLTMVERNNVVRGIEDQLREIFGPVVFEARIPRSLKLEEAHARHESIFTYAPKSPGAVAYKALAEEVLNHASGEEDGDRDPERNPSAHSAA